MTTPREDTTPPGPKPCPALQPPHIQGLQYFGLILDLLALGGDSRLSWHRYSHAPSGPGQCLAPHRAGD